MEPAAVLSRVGELTGGKLAGAARAPAPRVVGPEVQVERVWDDIVKKLFQKDYTFDAATYGSMNEYVTVSSSSYDPASLATKLTEKSTQGWTVVAIVPTGGDVTAFLSRSASAVAGSGSAEAESSSPADET